MPHFLHLRDEVGAIQQPLWGISPRTDEFGFRRKNFQKMLHLLFLQYTKRQCDIDLV